MKTNVAYLFGLLVVIAVDPSASGVVVDGSRAGDGYGQPFAVQAVQTGFGDNQSELNAAYARVQDDRLYMMFTGNLENVWNRMELFIDSTPGGMNEVTRPGSAFDRFTFDAGFEPDFLLESISGPGKFVFHYIEYDSDITSGTDSYLDVFAGEEQGAAQTEPGPTFGYSFDLAFDNSNTAGVTGGTEAADPIAAAAVQTGIELGIPLAAIGSPEGPFKILAMINGAGANFLSNQFLGSMTPPQGNLGSDGAGNLYQTLGLIDLNDFEGEQYFTFDPDRLVADLDGDGFVGLGDLDMILANWNQNTPPADPLVDPTGDGFVGLEDLDIVLGNWNAGTPHDESTNIPEPTTSGIVAGLVLLFVFGRRCLAPTNGFTALNAEGCGHSNRT